jgi:hypothetical protein
MSSSFLLLNLASGNRTIFEDTTDGLKTDRK